jgi:hypothetical protein
MTLSWLDLRVTAWLTVLFTTIGGGVFALGFIFPTGRGHTPAWDRGLRIAAVLTPVMFVTVFLIRPGPLHTFPTIDNPFGFGPDLRPLYGDEVSARISAMAVLLLPLVAWSVASRYRLAGHHERQQLKWFGLATVLTIGTLAIAGAGAVLFDDPPEVSLALFGFVGALVPVAIGIAILRHGLYDIDRLISRTLGYGLVTGVLVALLTVSVVALSAALGSLAEGNSLAVALSTLLVAVLFGPIRGRAQAVIDRRFDRARYDAQRTVDAFAEEVRNDVDLGALRSALLRKADEAVRPVMASVWLRDGPARREAAGS